MFIGSLPDLSRQCRVFQPQLQVLFHLAQAVPLIFSKTASHHRLLIRQFTLRKSAFHAVLPGNGHLGKM
jgi:hypothetical protein